MTLESRLLDEARRLGFDRAGIASPAPADGFDRLAGWLDRGFAGDMAYMHNHREARRDPRSIYPPVRAVIMVGMNYAPDRSRRVEPAEHPARIALYAQAADYHLVLRERLRLLGRWLKEQVPGCWGRVCVDSAPLLERDFARRAGLGWFGKNTMLLDRRLGSFFVLGGLLVDVPLEPTAPFEASHCGTCTACLDACPTGAFAAPYQLDARRCISYLTIEVKTALPEKERREVGDWLFGCDICQDVCPWNRKAPPAAVLTPRPDLERVDAAELLALDADAFRERFAGTALHPRPGRAVVLRNAALVLGNTGDESALPALRRALDDPEPLVRDAAAWAIARIQERR